MSSRDYKIEKLQKLSRKLHALEEETQILFSEARSLLGGEHREEFTEKLRKISGLHRDRALLTNYYFEVNRS